jgi:hypothetical protein
MKWRATAYSRFCIFFENALVSLLNRLMLILIVRFWRSVKLVEILAAGRLERFYVYWWQRLDLNHDIFRPTV